MRGTGKWKKPRSVPAKAYAEGFPLPLYAPGGWILNNGAWNNKQKERKW